MKNLAAAGMLFGATAAWAGTSLIDGQPLEYNHAYRCKGERVIVAHCRDDDDSSYCQVVYPDRPFVNGMQVAPVEMRGDIVGKLNNCNQVASAPGATEAPAAHRADSVPAKGSGGAKYVTRAPGVDKASWSLLDLNSEMAIYFVKAKIKRTGHKAEGWFTAVYPSAQDLSPAIKGVQFFQMDLVADCAKATLVGREGVYFNEDLELVTGAPLQPKPVPMDRESFTLEEFNVLCGKPQKLFVDKPLDSDGLGMLFIYLGFLRRD